MDEQKTWLLTVITAVDNILHEGQINFNFPFNCKMKVVYLQRRYKPSFWLGGVAVRSTISKEAGIGIFSNSARADKTPQISSAAAEDSVSVTATFPESLRGAE